MDRILSRTQIHSFYFSLYILPKVNFQWRQTLIFIGGALSTFFENQPFLSDYWWCKIYFYTLNSRIIGGAAAPAALQVWRH